jgi:cell division transport system permease protein
MKTDVEKYNRRGRQTGFISVIVGIALVLFMLGLVIGAYFGLENLQNTAKEQIEIDLFFDPQLNDADIKIIEQELAQWEEIKNIRFVSPERALEIFLDNEQQAQEIYAIYGGKSPLPTSVTFNPISAVVNRDDLAALSSRILKSYEGKVTEVSYDENRVNDVNLGFLQWIYLFVAIGILLAIVAFAMINNTIRLSLYSKRFIIKTMQLVGAKSSFIRAPFLWGAVLQGFLSSCIGMGLLMAVLFGISKYMEQLTIIYTFETFVYIFTSLLLIGIFISLFSTWFALNRYLRKRLDDLY